MKTWSQEKLASATGATTAQLEKAILLQDWYRMRKPECPHISALTKDLKEKIREEIAWGIIDLGGLVKKYPEVLKYGTIIDMIAAVKLERGKGSVVERREWRDQLVDATTGQKEDLLIDMKAISKFPKSKKELKERNHITPSFKAK